MRHLTWIDPAGQAWAFGFGSPVYAGPGVQVAGMPPIRASEIIVPTQAGSRWQLVDHGPRDVMVPIDVYSIAPDVTMDQFAAAVDPTRGDGRLRVTAHNGSDRDLYCRLVDGLSVTEQTNSDDGWPSMLMFRAVDPYWYDRFEGVLTFSPVGSGTTFFPIFPLQLGASELTTSATVHNDGHVQSWPVIEARGPGSVTVTNATTSEWMDLDYDIAEGETVTVDTRPGVKTVWSSVAGDVFSELSNDSALWPIEKGTNQIIVAMAGATTASRVRLRWWRRWLTA